MLLSIFIFHFIIIIIRIWIIRIRSLNWICFLWNTCTTINSSTNRQIILILCWCKSFYRLSSISLCVSNWNIIYKLIWSHSYSVYIFRALLNNTINQTFIQVYIKTILCILRCTCTISRPFIILIKYHWKIRLSRFGSCICI